MKKFDYIGVLKLETIYKGDLLVEILVKSMSVIKENIE